MASNGGSRKRLAVKIAKTAKTGVVWVTNDDVIENFDFEKLARSNEVTGDFDVRLGWSRLTARMIVRDYDGRGARHDSQTEYFAGMTEDRIHRSNGHQIMTLDAPTCVEDEHHQTFTFRVEVGMCRDMRFPIGGCLIWCFTVLHSFGCGTFPQ